MEFLKRCFSEIFFLRTRSFEQYNDEINIKNQLKKKSEIEGGVAIFHDMLDHKQKTLHHLFTG